MFQGEGTDLYGLRSGIRYLWKVHISWGLDTEEVRASLGLVGGESAQNLYLAASHETDSDWRLLIGLELGLDEEFGADDLAFPASGLVVSVDGEGGIVHHDESGFQGHLI